MIDRRAFLSLVAVVASLGWTAPAAAEPPPGWYVAGSRIADYELDTDVSSRFGTRTNPYIPGVDPARLTAGRTAIIRSRPGASPSGFVTLYQGIEARRWRGLRVKLTAMVKTRGADRVQLWMRIDGKNGQVLAFDAMRNRAITGSRPWRRYSIVLEVPRDAVSINFGFLLAGSGVVWADDFELVSVERSTPLTAGRTLPQTPVNPGFDRQAPAPRTPRTGP